MSFNAFKEFMVGFLFENQETSKLYSYNFCATEEGSHRVSFLLFFSWGCKSRFASLVTWCVIVLHVAEKAIYCNAHAQMPKAFPSDTATGSSLHYFVHIVKDKFVLAHLLTVLTKHACQHNSFWRSLCDSSHAPLFLYQSVAWYACDASLGKERYVRLNEWKTRRSVS